MDLHFRYVQSLQGVVQSVGVVGPGARVYDEPGSARRFSNEGDHLTLGVSLPELQVQIRKLVFDEPLYVEESRGSVDFGTTGAEGAQVHAVEDEHLTQRSPRWPRGLLPRPRGCSLRASLRLRGARTCAG